MRRPLPGFEGLYEVSDVGVVYRIARGKGGKPGPLKPYLMNSGYLVVDPSKNDRRKHTAIHHAVAAAFLGPRNGREVNHKNGNKLDNRAENLEYVTRLENARHASRSGLLQRGEQRFNAVLNSQKVREIRRLRGAGLLHKEIAARLSISRGTVGDVLRGETWGWVV